LEVFQANDGDLLSSAVAAYAAALAAMGACTTAACPSLGQDLQQQLEMLSAGLSTEMSGAELAATEAEVEEQLEAWGRRTAGHYRQKASEVKDLLMSIARTAESVGDQDLRCAEQMREVTARLHEIASLDDLTRMRASIKKSASALKISIDKMNADRMAIVDQLQKEILSCQARLEEAEEIAARDALTGVRSRLNVEHQMEARIAAKTPFCAAILDIDDFKKINDEYGHVIGDELLKQFAGELRSICRSTDVLGRWGGDEFIILLDCGLEAALTERDRLCNWVCGSYTVQGSTGAARLTLDISVGVAEYNPGEPVKELLARADSAMYEQKGIARNIGSLAAR
jgi:diguanylate cyclase (GGDEF)-like protein